MLDETEFTRDQATLRALQDVCRDNIPGVARPGTTTRDDPGSVTMLLAVNGKQVDALRPSPAPAIANAVASLIGARVRPRPMRPDRVLAAVKN